MNQKLIQKIIEKELEKDSVFYPFIAGLEKRERVVLHLREQSKRLQFIGNKLNLTRERVRQIEAKANMKLQYKRKIIESLAKELSEYLFEEREIEQAFDQYLSKSIKAITPRKMEWADFNKLLWQLKSVKNEARR